MRSVKTSVMGPLKQTPVNSSTRPSAGDGPDGGDIVRAVDSPWAERLRALHRQVRLTVSKAGRASAENRNAKGDEVKLFDLAADDTALAALGDFDVSMVVVSEESGCQEIGAGAQYRLVLDPVDGSDNWARGLPLSALSCAVLPIDAPLHPDWVEAALVGPLERDVPLIALKNSGAWRDRERLQTSGVRDIAGAMISVELNHHSPSPGLARLMSAARGVRCYGCASRAISLVAESASDAYVDLRGRLTAESYLAAARLLVEAGGCVVGLDGKPVAAPENLTDRVSLIAASSRELCHEIVEMLASGQN
jgi:myo-inositol-1(or 4)-monophosphatase